MSLPDKELEEQLMEAGNKLQEPPPSVDELLPLLDKLEACLLKVEQSPSKAMQNALSPSLKALVSDKLLRHSDVDVKVAVASCISEITRITAPDAPYDDDRMKEVFHLIVSSFENLSDKSSRSFKKRAAILETVAKVRSCVVMLDLECDALIVEMFQHFLKSIRDYHPENVFTSMETIMTLVIEESEDVSPDLLFPILASAKKDNEEILPIARKLGEKVLCKCAAKLKPYLGQALKTLGLSSDDYCKTVASICKGSSEAIEQNEVPVTEDKVDKEGHGEITCSQGVSACDKSSKSVVTNGVSQSEKKDSSGGLVSTKKVENSQEDNASKIASSNGEPGKMDNEDASDSLSKADPTTKIKGIKSNASAKATKSEAGSQLDGEKDAEEVEDVPQEEISKDVPQEEISKDAPQEEINEDVSKEEISEGFPTSPHENLPAEADVPSESAKETTTGSYPPKEGRNESANVASPSHSGELPDDSHLPREELVKSKDGSDEEVETLAADSSKKASEGMGATEIERDTMMENRSADSEGKSVSADDVAMKDTDATSDSEAKPSKQTSKKAAAGVVSRDEVSAKRSVDKKRKRSGKMSAKSKSSTKDDNKKIASPSKLVIKSAKAEERLVESPKDSSKKKKIPLKGKESSADADGEALVGRRIKVWWPLDKEFYEGTVDSYDRKKKKHKVFYSDGDKEVLNLREEKWRFCEESGDEGQEEGSDDESPDASEMPKKKKGTLKSDLSTNKQKEREGSSKKGGVASSSKAKNASSSGKIPKDGNKVDRKPKEDDGSTSEKSEDESEVKAKYHTPESSNKAVDVARKMAGKSKSSNLASPPKSTKSKNVDSGNDKVSMKTKHETPKLGKSSQDMKATLKERTTKSSGKSNANGPGKAKPGSSKSKPVDEEDDSAKKRENKKRNLSDTSQGNSRSESGKKRRK